MSQPFAFHLGVTVTDKITNFEGRVTARVEYITGCNQYLVQPKMAQDDKTKPAAEWFDEQRLDENKYIDRLVLDNSVSKGFGQQAPIK